MIIEDIFVLGTGESLLRYKTEIKSLKDRITLGFQGFFPHCIKHFGFYPNYWFCFDPNSLLLGMDYIYSLLKSNQQISMKLFIPDFFLLPSVQDINEYTMTGKPLQKMKRLEYTKKYLNIINKIIENDVIETEVVKCMTPRKDMCMLDISKTERFKGDVLYLGSGVHEHEHENKISRCVFPILHKMQTKNAYIVGFDGCGGRFYNIKQRISTGSFFHYVEKWTRGEWCKYKGFNTFNTISDEFTSLNNYMDYIPLNKALGETKNA